MSKARERRKSEDRGPVWLALALNVLRGGLAAFAVAALVLLVAACVVSVGVLGDDRIGSAVIAACLFGSFAGGIVSILRQQNVPIVSGMLVGIVLFLILLSAGFLLYGNDGATGSVGSVFCACMCGGGLAGVLGSRPKKKRRR